MAASSAVDWRLLWSRTLELFLPANETSSRLLHSEVFERRSMAGGNSPPARVTAGMTVTECLRELRLVGLNTVTALMCRTNGRWSIPNSPHSMKRRSTCREGKCKFVTISRRHEVYLRKLDQEEAEDGMVSRWTCWLNILGVQN